MAVAKNRITIAIILFASVILLDYLGAIAWSLVILCTALAAFFEFNKLCNNMGIFLVNRIIPFFISLFILTPLIFKNGFELETVLVVQAISLLAAYTCIFPRIILRATYTKFEDLTASLWAVFQLGLLPSFFVWVRLMDNGFGFTLISILSIALNDSASMLGGKIFGKHKLSTSISPGKTIEGSLIGLTVGSLTFVFLAKIFHLHFTNDYILVAIAIVFNILGQIGDLLVSALKRAAGVKDSGTVLMSHGGILDRIDSHIFAAWFAYFAFALSIK